MNTKHTPGPWFENINQRPKGQSIEITNGNLTASPLAYVPHHGKFSEANARLMATAPDMSELLLQLQEGGSLSASEWAAVAALLTKAGL